MKYFRDSIPSPDIRYPTPPTATYLRPGARCQVCLRTGDAHHLTRPSGPQPVARCPPTLAPCLRPAVGPLSWQPLSLPPSRGESPPVRRRARPRTGPGPERDPCQTQAGVSAVIFRVDPFECMATLCANIKNAMSKYCANREQTLSAVIFDPFEGMATLCANLKHAMRKYCANRVQTLASQGLLGVVGGPAHGPRVDVV